MGAGMRRVIPDPVARSAFADRYPHEPTGELAQQFGISMDQAYRLAQCLGLKKSEAYLSGPHARRFTGAHEGSKATQFKPGHKTWNAGKKGW